MIIKAENEFKLTIVHFARLSLMQSCARAWVYRWTNKPSKIRTEQPGLPGLGHIGGAKIVVDKNPGQECYF